jgi:hypothetical protein
LLHDGGRYISRIALPFGWSRLAIWFVNLLKPFEGRIRRWCHPVLSYIADFLVAAAIARASTAEDFQRASTRIGDLTRKLGLERHEAKGVWGDGEMVVDHLGFRWDSIRLLFTVTQEKQKKVRVHAKAILKEAAGGRGWVCRDSPQSFAGVATSLHVALPLALFYTRSLHDVVGDYS